MGNKMSLDEKDPSAIRLGILGAARISGDAVIKPANLSKDVIIAAVASRSEAKGKDFAKKNGIPKVYTDYQELLDDKEIDAIYNPLPNGLHAEWTIKALQAGKHVLCEKPFSSNEDEAKQVKEVVDQHPELVMMEAVHYQYHPANLRVKDIIKKGEIGDIKNIHAKFNFASYLKHFVSVMGDDDIRFQYDLAGGITMDAGFYPINAIRWFSDMEPEVTEAKAQLLRPEIDHTMHAKFQFPNHATASMETSFRASQMLPADMRMTVEGTKGKVTINNFIAPHMFHSITVEDDLGNTRTEKVYGEDSNTTYYHQMRAFVAAIRGGPKPPTDVNEAIKTMRVIDQVYLKAGLMRRGEKKME
eukprot:TRINITY_DN99_c0_g1_i1.p1 TRINITY_DN99_c0_g1~~TRINITY_DN99_c0_g1_i1.p1  ORF type:complete len:393 (-),score=127.72 TRINITY_DN99_c0_g1_i1:177-1250(-)